MYEQQNSQSKIKSMKIFGLIFAFLGIINFVFRVIKSDYDLFAITLGFVFIIIGLIFFKFAPSLSKYFRER